MSKTHSSSKIARPHKIILVHIVGLQNLRDRISASFAGEASSRLLEVPSRFQDSIHGGDRRSFDQALLQIPHDQLSSRERALSLKFFTSGHDQLLDRVGRLASQARRTSGTILKPRVQLSTLLGPLNPLVKPSCRLSYRCTDTSHGLTALKTPHRPDSLHLRPLHSASVDRKHHAR